MRHRTLVIAHDGSEGSQPHTVEAVMRGLEAGADIVEVDVRATRDGVAVLQHDDTVALDGRTIRLAEITCKELERLHLSGTDAGATPIGKITTLEEVLNAVRGLRCVVNLDIKEDAAVEPAVKAVRRNEMINRVVFSGCEGRRARHLKAHHRDCQVLLNASEPQYDIAKRNYRTFMSSLCEEAVEAGCCGINVYQTFCTEELVSFATLRFLPVSVWTVDETERLKQLLALSVDAITTNRVSILRGLM